MRLVTPTQSVVLTQTSLVLKATVFPEWNSRILPEWFAYVPVKVDYSDLFSVMSLSVYS